MEFVIVMAVIGLLVYLILVPKKKKTRYTGPVPGEWKKILENKVTFYQHLSPNEKDQFEKRVQHFLNTTRITGIDTDVSLEDMLLVGASAIIPVFAFPEWEYGNLKEVLLYPAPFNRKFQSSVSDSNILGMVGTGYMEGKMILSKPSLHSGFENHRDKKNVGIHEFVHLIDKADGELDGLPRALLKNPAAIPWLKMVQQNMEEIHRNHSDINPYGGVSKEEFLPVIAEYFFEQPDLFKKKHPELYRMLSEIFSAK